MADKLKALIELLCSTSTQSLDARLKRAGIQEAELAEICSSPDAAGAIYQAAAHRYLLPVIPEIFKHIGARASQGDRDAGKQVIAILADKGGVRDQLGIDISTASDAALVAMAKNMMEQLAAQLPKEADGSNEGK